MTLLRPRFSRSYSDSPFRDLEILIKHMVVAVTLELSNISKIKVDDIQIKKMCTKFLSKNTKVLWSLRDVIFKRSSNWLKFLKLPKVIAWTLW